MRWVVGETCTRQQTVQITHIFIIYYYIFVFDDNLDILNKTGVYPYFFVCQCEIMSLCVFSNLFIRL